jgi:hypothetical protein
MLTLHDYRASLNGWKVRGLLGLLGSEYRYREIAPFQGESRTEAFLRLNFERYAALSAWLRRVAAEIGLDYSVSPYTV